MLSMRSVAVFSFFMRAVIPAVGGQVNLEGEGNARKVYETSKDTPLHGLSLFL